VGGRGEREELSSGSHVCFCGMDDFDEEVESDRALRSTFYGTMKCVDEVTGPEPSVGQKEAEAFWLCLTGGAWRDGERIG
jgi:hypothetical protein